jgi:hypothetical protein
MIYAHEIVKNWKKVENADLTIGYIYIITCMINEKIYIGKTMKYRKCCGRNYHYKFGYKGRFLEHLRDAFDPSNGQYDAKFHRAIRKYGKENFVVELLIKCKVEELDMYETRYIKQWKTTDIKMGYNTTDGGEGGRMTEEVIEKIRNTVNERYKNPEYKQRVIYARIKSAGEQAKNGAFRRTNISKTLPPYIHECKNVGYRVYRKGSANISQVLGQFTDSKKTKEENLGSAIQFAIARGLINAADYQQQRP